MAQRAWMRWAAGIVGAAAGSSALAQVPDLLSAFESGSRAMAMGGSTQATDVTPHAALLNPAGLGYIASPTLSVSFRNLPEADTGLSGDISDPEYDTVRQYGRTAFSHIGYALPVGKGTLGISYATAGWLLENQASTAIKDGALTRVGYGAFRKAQTDLFTLSYGATHSGGSWGLGVVYANQYVKTREAYDVYSGVTRIGVVDSSASGNARGVGVVGGLQFAAGADGMWGISVRSPISLSGNSDVIAKYGRIPGNASLGYAGKRAVRRGSDDYLVYSLQGSYAFGGKNEGSFARKNGATFGLGLEYSLNRAETRWPIRLGYQKSPSMGSGFADRDAFTFGLGYRPNSGRLGVDLSFQKDTKGGPIDAALGLTYRFGK